MAKREFKWLLPEKVPSLVYKRRSDYDECIEEFLQSDLKSARVTISDVKPASLQSILTKRIERKDLKHRIAVRKWKEKVYLVKLE